MSNRSTARKEQVARGRPEPSRPAPSELHPLEAEEPSPRDLSAEELEEVADHPLPGKAHPPAEMDEAKPTLDDEVRRYHHHPNDAGTIEFGFDPEAADAAADLAGDLGSQFLEGATRGEDMSDRVMSQDDRSESEMPFLIEEELGAGEDTDEPVESEAELEEQQRLLERLAGDGGAARARRPRR